MTDQILIQNGNIYQKQGWLKPGFVIIEAGKIKTVLGGQPTPEQIQQATRVIDATNMAILPGLVNGHSHFSQSFMRGLAGGRPLLRWLKELIWPLQMSFSVEETYLAAMLGLAENLRGGVTNVVDHHKITLTREHTLAVKRAVEEIGIRCTIARSWANRGTNAEDGDAILAEMADWYALQQPGEKVSFASGPLTPWRATAELLQKSHEQAMMHGSFTHIHVSETDEEVQMTLAETGVRPVTWLDQLGILDEHSQIVHAVWVEEDEIELLKERNALVVHCPVSNAVLGSGIAPVGRMLQHGVRLRLGTDGSASNDTQDCIENTKMAICLARAGQRDANNISNRQALEMSLDGRSVTPGEEADLTLINLNTLRSIPVHDLTSAVTLCAHAEDVDMVLVDGKVLMQHGKLTTVDEEILIKECNLAIQSLKKRAGIEV